MSFRKKNFQEIRDVILDNIVAKGLITDRNVGSVTRTLVEAYAREVATLYEEMQKVFDSAYVDTATGRSLDFVVAILGIKRIKAEQAVGTVLFSRQTPAEGDITIPQGTIITRPRQKSGDQPPLFETTETRTLQQGEREIEVPVRAEKIGDIGIVNVGELTVLPRPIVGIETVSNQETTVLRVREESDEELRRRAKNALRNTGKATGDAIEFAIRELGAESVEILDRPRGLVGEIEIIVDGKGLDDEDRKREIKKAINDTKAAGIRAILQVTTRIHIFLKLRLTLKEAMPIEEELVILDDVGSQIEEYISSLEVGEIVRRNGIISAALNNPHVLEIEFLPVDEAAQDLLFKTGSVENGKRVPEEPEDKIRERILKPGGDIFIGKQERAILDRVTDLDLTTKERKFSVFVDIEDDNLVLSGVTTSTEEQIIELIKADIQKCLISVETQREEQQKNVSLSYEDLRSKLEIEGYTIKESNLKIVLLHSFDGLENTLQVDGHRDIIKTNETTELRNVNLQVNIA